MLGAGSSRRVGSHRLGARCSPYLKQNTSAWSAICGVAGDPLRWTARHSCRDTPPLPESALPAEACRRDPRNARGEGQEAAGGVSIDHSPAGFRHGLKESAAGSARAAEGDESVARSSVTGMSVSAQWSGDRVEGAGDHSSPCFRSGFLVTCPVEIAFDIRCGMIREAPVGRLEKSLGMPAVPAAWVRMDSRHFEPARMLAPGPGDDGGLLRTGSGDHGGSCAS